MSAVIRVVVLASSAWKLGADVDTAPVCMFAVSCYCSHCVGDVVVVVVVVVAVAVVLPLFCVRVSLSACSRCCSRPKSS